MFGRNTRSDDSPEMRAVRDTAQRESRPYNDPEADYPTARDYRRSRAEGEARREAA